MPNRASTPSKRQPKAVTGSGAPASTRRRVSGDKTRSEMTGAKIRSSRSTVMRQALAGLTAAGEVLDDSGKARSNSPGSPTRTWQHAVIGYCRSVPELNAAKMYVGNCHAQIHLKVGKRNPDGSVEDGFDGAEPVDGLDAEIAKMSADIISTIRSKIGGQSELLRSFGEKEFSVGESYLIPEDSPAGLTFEVLSVQELSKDGGKWIVHNGPGYDNEPLPEGVEPLRIWRPDDVYRKQATSSVRACVEVLEELVILTRLVRSSAISRMALAGILAIAEEFDEPIDDEGEDGQTAESANPLLVDIILNGAKAIDDPASAASWLPYLLSGPKDLIKDGINFIEFKHDDAVKVVQRREALERLAQGLDLPVETVLGFQGTTYANAAQIDEDRFRIHLEPSIQLFCDAVTIGILWPYLAKKKGLTPEQIRDNGYPPEILTAAVTYDASDLISRPDKAKDIVSLYNGDTTQSSVRIAEVRMAVGLDADEAPDEEEVTVRLERQRAARTQVREIVPMPPISDPAAAAVLSGPDAAASAGVTASLALVNGLAERIAGAAELTMERTAERVGAKLRSKLKGEQAKSVDGMANSEISRTLGPSVVTRLLNGDDPIGTEIGVFERTVAKWARDAGQRNPGELAKGVGLVLTATMMDRLFTQGPASIDTEAVLALTSVGS